MVSHGQIQVDTSRHACLLVPTWTGRQVGGYLHIMTHGECRERDKGSGDTRPDDFPPSTTLGVVFALVRDSLHERNTRQTTDRNEDQSGTKLIHVHVHMRTSVYLSLCLSTCEYGRRRREEKNSLPLPAV